MIRKALSAVPVILSLLALAVPALGQPPSVPAKPAADVCAAPAPASPLALPELQKQPFFKSGTCGNCSDPGCKPPVVPGAVCGGGEGTCAGVFLNGHVVNCTDGSGLYCTCI